MDIVVTIPKTEYANDDRETEYFLSDPDAYQFWVMKRIPKKLEVRDRVYFVRGNKIESSMQVYDIHFDVKTKCEVTGREWHGCTLYMYDLKQENLEMEVKGFQGFRYKWW